MCIHCDFVGRFFCVTAPGAESTVCSKILKHEEVAGGGGVVVVVGRFELTGGLHSTPCSHPCLSSPRYLFCKPA